MIPYMKYLNKLLLLFYPKVVKSKTIKILIIYACVLYWRVGGGGGGSRMGVLPFDSIVC